MQTQLPSDPERCAAHRLSRMLPCNPQLSSIPLTLAFVAILFGASESAFAQRHNANTKWGATFYYWDPYTLPNYSSPPKQSPWGPGSQGWWDDVVSRADLKSYISKALDFFLI